MSETAIVIGAGVIGASIAWRLAQRGLRVTLIDAGKAGGEASWAGAGMLAPGGEINQWNQWAEFTLHSHGLYPAFVEELRRETGYSIDYQQHGAIEVAKTEADWIALQQRAERQIRSKRQLSRPDPPPNHHRDQTNQRSEQRTRKDTEQYRAPSQKRPDRRQEF